MKLKITIIVLTVLFLSGCPPKKFTVENRSIRSIEVGELSRNHRLLENNRDIERVSGATEKIMSSSNFSLLRSNYSFGIDPFTGRTKNLYFKYLDNKFLYCNIVISKHQYKISFIEVERAPKTGEFLTSENQKNEIARIAEKLKIFAEGEYSGNKIDVNVY